MIRLTTLILASWIILGPGSAWSQTHEHKHEHEGSPNAGLTLDNGKKWKTDAPLREGMVNIRNISQLAQKSNTSDSNQRAATQMSDEIQKIFKNCKLPPKADAMLHPILADMMSSIAKLKDPKANGAEAYANISKALDSYQKYFDHPGWESTKN